MKPSVFVPATRTIYVDKYSLRSGETGAIDHPFKTIQAAVDHAGSLGSTADSTIKISIGPGVYQENIVVKDVDYVYFKGSGHRYHTVVYPVSGPALTVTNATLASLAAYRLSGVYSDLDAEAIPEAGPQLVSAKDIRFRSAAGNSIELLGVKGDAGAGASTGFLNGGGCKLCQVVTNQLYARNVATVGLSLIEIVIPMILVNCASFVANWAQIGTTSWTWDTTDAEGYSSATFVEFMVANSRFNSTFTATSNVAKFVKFYIVHSDLAITISGLLKPVFNGSVLIGNLTLNDTTILTASQTIIGGNVVLAAGASFAMKGSEISGALTVAAGAGVVTLSDTGVEGTITDAGAKIVYSTSNVRSGTATAAAPGDVVVTFSPALSRSNYRISLGNVGAANAVVKAGTKTAAGFTLTFAAAGDCDWSATLGQ